MALTARMARLKMPNFRCRTSRRNYQNTGNALFTGPFYYTNPCIKNVVLIDSVWYRGCVLMNMYDYLECLLREKSVVKKYLTTDAGESSEVVVANFAIASQHFVWNSCWCWRNKASQNEIMWTIAEYATVQKESHTFKLLQILQQLRIVETVKFGCRDDGSGHVPYRGFREC